MKTTKDLSFRFAYAFVVRQMKTIYINKLKDLEVGNIIPLQGLLNLSIFVYMPWFMPFIS